MILGPSGSGKSTLLNMLGELDTLDEGELTVAGRKVTGLYQEQRTDYRKEDVGFIFQFYNLIPDLTVEENIEVVADISRSPCPWRKCSRSWISKNTVAASPGSCQADSSRGWLLPGP